MKGKPAGRQGDRMDWLSAVDGHVLRLCTGPRDFLNAG